MKFSVIYSVDVPHDVDIAGFAPPVIKELWEQTEDDDQYEYDHLEGRWENGHHRKWCGVLDRQQFDEFVDHCGLLAEDVETMGSLGAPRFALGWAPAVSFNGSDPDAIQNAYVTPIPEVNRQHCKERDWDRVRNAVLAIYG